MDNIEIFQIDAFTDKVFHGNPAAVCLLSEWLNDELMQAIAAENNVSETAFVINDDQGFHIRWFTPDGEITLCGHATLAAAFVLFELELCKDNEVSFHSLSGLLPVHKKKEQYILDFPQLGYKPAAVPEAISSLIDQPVLEIYESDLDYLAILASEALVMASKVNLKKLKKLEKRGLIISAPGQDVDFYSRCFYPKHNISEDPVTGSAHCVLAPFWFERLGKSVLNARQGLRRKGDIFCEINHDRVLLSGSCRWYSKGHLVI